MVKFQNRCIYIRRIYYGPEAVDELWKELLTIIYIEKPSSEVAFYFLYLPLENCIGSMDLILWQYATRKI
jgi:hypothetical protein